jgi:exopolysaccharide biosynthesis polyprenyl glycosylphosphotransferase
MALPAKELPPVEDVRVGRPYLLNRSPLTTLARRSASVVALASIDIAGLIIGLYGALAIRALLRDPRPILWNVLWTDAEAKWLPFLILVLLLVFWRNRLYGPRELREGAGRIIPSVMFVALLALAFAIGTDQPVRTFGLYVTGGILTAALISLFRWSYESVTSSLMRSLGVRRRVLLVGDADQVDHLRASLGPRRGGIDYAFLEAPRGPGLQAVLDREHLDELVVADAGLDQSELLEIVEVAHRHGVKVRVAPRTTELLLERGQYVPGQALPLFELRPPILAGSDWVLKRSFDVVVSALVIVLGIPLWIVLALAIKLTSRGPVFYADERIGVGERRFRLLKLRTMVAGAASSQAALEPSNEASGALFKIRDDPRVTPVGRLLRRFSLDEVPNVINVLRGEMSLVGPRPLPVRDYARLEPWHRRRSEVLPGMTGIWQIAGRSDLSFDDLVRLDFYYLENWSLWLDITILVKTIPAVLSRRGAY